MKKMLLINVADPWLTNGGDRPSLGTLYIASWLRKTNSAEPSVIDLNHYGDADLLKRLEEFNPDLIGISLTTPQYEESVRVARFLKQNTNIPIIAGGPHVTAMQYVPKVPELMPTDCFDYVLTGPGERTLERIFKEGLPSQRKITGEPLPVGKNLDWLPEPARDLVNMDRYKLEILGKKATPLMTSFGCPYSCSFCSEPILNNKFKAYSPERVVSEMKNLNERYGIEGFIIYDDVYSIDAKRAIEIANLIKKEGLDVVYRCTTRATDFIRKPELADKLYSTGCVEICIGLESADESILKHNDKGMSVEANKKGIAAIKKSGARCLTYMITGLPGCTIESEQKSLDFIKDTHADEVGWYMLAPFPSTPLWVNRDRFGLTIYEDEIIKNHWDVAQCRADNENLTCYVDYSTSGGLSRKEIKEVWLKMRNEVDIWQKSRGEHSIQYSESTIAGMVK